MKILITTILLTLINYLSNAQTFTSTYIHKINSVPSQLNYEVIQSQGKTWSTTTGVIKFTDDEKPVERTIYKNGKVLEKMDDDNVRIIRKKDFPEYYKNENKNLVLSRNYIQGHSIYITEELNQMEWDISDKTIVHNKRTCNIATTEFRGKKWTVYFDTSIPFNVAPWKFHGLPGVVIFAKTSDNMFVFKLKDYEIKEGNTDIKNPFEKEKLYSWNTYTKKYKEYLKKMLKYTSSPEDEGEGKITINNTIEDLGFTEVIE